MIEALDDAQRESLKARLLQMIEEATSAIAEREAAGATVELDQSRQGRLSRMDAMQAQAMQQAAAQRAHRDLSRAQAALTRIDAPEFGRCKDCDEVITAARLLLDPTARLCIHCAAQSER